jgi:hypothetical protein
MAGKRMGESSRGGVAEEEACAADIWTIGIAGLRWLR